MDLVDVPTGVNILSAEDIVILWHLILQKPILKKQSMAKSKNRTWIKQHVKDPYVVQSQRDGYRSRAELQTSWIVEKERLIRPGMVVVDLGSAPGGWSQVAAELVGDKGTVVGVDITAHESYRWCKFIQGDFTEDVTLERLVSEIGGKLVDLVISDIAPNISGMKAVDQPRSYVS